MQKFKDTLKSIKPIDERIVTLTQSRLDGLTKPLGSLGALEELAKQICGISAKSTPNLSCKVIFTLAADHGITEEGVSPYPKEVTAQMVYNFLNSGAAINVLAKHVGARVIIADFGVCVDLKANPKLIVKKQAYGTKNMAKGPAMSKDEAINAIEAGIELFEAELLHGIDIAGTGEMGIGNTSSASAITACITEKSVESVTGKGAGLTDAGLKTKIAIIKKAIKVNKPDKDDPIDVLSKLGGFEIAGLVGIILASAAKRVPIVIDGFISSAAALIAYCLEPKTAGYMIPAHKSIEAGHAHVLAHIGLRPLLDLNMRLGEGTGAALGISLADASIKILTQMATFESAAVSKKT